MRRTATLLFLLYLLVLTAGLLVQNPFAVAGQRESWLRDFYFAYVEPVGHFLGFFMLGLLASLSNWPRRFVTRFALLLLYAGATEALQAWIPPRTPELKDLLQNFTGATVGAALGWAVVRWRAKSLARRGAT